MLLKFDECVFAPWEDRTCVTCLGHCGFDKGGVVSAAMESILNPETALCAKVARPLSVDLAFEVECALFVREITGCDEKGEAQPESKSVDG